MVPVSIMLSAFDNCFLQCIENILCFCHLKYDEKIFLVIDVKFVVESNCETDLTSCHLVIQLRCQISFFV